ncbi:MAG: peptidase M3 [Erysipelotrichia bacterium]|nr:peptidase M3 [Erysipelotrichia bacterium]NCC53997.1 peptidase M3 [Erysipelotrichia bacterium]
MKEYNLDVLYTGFDDPKYKEDFQALEDVCKQMNEYSDNLSIPNQKETVITILKLSEQLQSLVEDLFTFIELKLAIHTSNQKAINDNDRLTQRLSTITKTATCFDQYIIACDDLERFIKEDDFLKNYAYYLLQIKKSGKYLLDDKVEEAIAKMNRNGGLAFEKQWDYLTSTLEVEMEGKSYTLSAIRNFAYDSDPAIRKKAFEAELKGYEKIKDAIAFSLNSIKGQVNTLCEMRGYESALAQALDASDMKQETLDAMLTAMKKYMPKFRQYLKRKAKLLGHENGLPFYDLFATIGEDDKKYSIEEAKDYLVSNFAKFSSELAEMVERAFDEQWIDFYPRKGKVGGAFCYNLPKYNQSRVLTNYDGHFSDIVTLAHELGHAFHGQQIAPHLPLNHEYSMPVAETASTFNENLIMNIAISEATGNTKIALMENQLQDTTQIILDIYSRFLFESEVFERRKKEFLFAPQLEEIMINAQKEAYGDGLDQNTLHPYMWVCKSHYYSTGLSFYNFPYAFGGLFARGLYALYQEQKETFLPKYKEMLYATTISSVEDCAKIMGIDLCDQAFWEKSLASYCEVIDAFLEATE